jgi:hypothetical protein
MCPKPLLASDIVSDVRWTAGRREIARKGAFGERHLQRACADDHLPKSGCAMVEAEMTAFLIRGKGQLVPPGVALHVAENHERDLLSGASSALERHRHILFEEREAPGPGTERGQVLHRLPGRLAGLLEEIQVRGLAGRRA